MSKKYGKRLLPMNWRRIYKRRVTRRIYTDSGLVYTVVAANTATVVTLSVEVAVRYFGSYKHLDGTLRKIARALLGKREVFPDGVEYVIKKVKKQRQKENEEEWMEIGT